MSRTFNTRPLGLQSDDRSLPAREVTHVCGLWQECDYSSNSGLRFEQDYWFKYVEHCRRSLVYWGGIQSGGPRWAKTRRWSKRMDSKVRRAAARKALHRMVDPDDFDISPVYADRGDSRWFD